MSLIQNERFLENHVYGFEDALDRNDRETAKFHVKVLKENGFPYMELQNQLNEFDLGKGNLLLDDWPNTPSWELGY